MTLNLVQHRGAPSVWDRACEPHRDTERWLLAVVAGGLLVSGVRQRSLGGLAMAIGGGTLAWLAAATADERNRWQGRFRAIVPWHPRQTDEVVEASEESFPASDAPAWTTGDPGHPSAHAR